MLDHNTVQTSSLCYLKFPLYSPIFQPYLFLFTSVRLIYKIVVSFKITRFSFLLIDVLITDG